MKKKACPICHRAVDEDIVTACQEAQGWVIESIRRQHPDWVEADGSCLRCLEYYQRLGDKFKKS